jgi:hypothetical protein
MGIFDSLKNAIFGIQPQSQPAQTSRPAQAQSTATPASQPNPTAQQAATTAGGAAGSAQNVDIESVLRGMAAKKTEKLNWQSSIVDLMKLVDLDPSLENRKALAGELGYTGDTRDSASMNIWLHQQVMLKLTAAGGKVPDSLRH